MRTFKLSGITQISVIIMIFGSEGGERFSIPEAQRLVPTAETRVGRPLTTVSVARVARRLVWRCAVGVYYFKLTELQSLTGRLGSLPISMAPTV